MLTTLREEKFPEMPNLHALALKIMPIDEDEVYEYQDEELMEDAVCEVIEARRWSPLAKYQALMALVLTHSTHWKYPELAVVFSNGKQSPLGSSCRSSRRGGWATTRRTPRCRSAEPDFHSPPRRATSLRRHTCSRRPPHSCHRHRGAGEDRSVARAPRLRVAPPDRTRRATIIEICQNLKLCQKACDLKLLGHADDAHVQLYRMRVGRKVEDKGKTLDEARAMMKEPGEAAKDALRKREAPATNSLRCKST